MKVIDMERKGNVVRFYLGNDDCNDYFGDDWDDYPFEYNCGLVYDEFVVSIADFAMPFDAVVSVPSDGDINSNWCRNDFKARRVPLMSIISAENRRVLDEDGWWDEDSFATISQTDVSVPIYMGMKYNDLEDTLGRVGALKI